VERTEMSRREVMVILDNIVAAAPPVSGDFDVNDTNGANIEETQTNTARRVGTTLSPEEEAVIGTANVHLLEQLDREVSVARAAPSIEETTAADGHEDERKPAVRSEQTTRDALESSEVMPESDKAMAK
jgi:hypothetical protein